MEYKLLTARDRLRITLNFDNVEYLTFKFMANIRPRAEIIIRSGASYNSDNINDYFKCSEAEFLEKTGVPA